MKKQILLLLMVGLMTIQNSIGSTKKDTTKIKNEITFLQNGYYAKQFEFRYAFRLSDKYWFKIGLQASGSRQVYMPLVSTTYRTARININSNILLGIDKHSVIKEKYEIIKGFNILFGDNFRNYVIDNPQLTEKQRNTSTHTLFGGIGFTLGFYYNFSNHFSVGSEFNPYVTYSFYHTEYVNQTVTNLNLANVSLVCIKYRF